MRLLLTNCSKCHRLMIPIMSPTICKQCFLERVEQLEADEEQQESALEQPMRLCQSCRRAMDTSDTYCVRCQLRLTRQTDEAVAELSGKLEKFPELRGTHRSSADESRFYIGEDIAAAWRSSARASRGRSTFTPSTKYSS